VTERIVARVVSDTARVHRSFTIIGQAPVARDNASYRIGRTRFAQEAGFDERPSASKPASVKIFLLPNIATQSPRSAHASAFDDARRLRLQADRRICELRKPLAYSRFLQRRQLPVAVFHAPFALARE
jgi:hypothetical protein